MKWRRQLSDAEFIERIRQQASSRRLRAAILLLFALVMSGILAFLLRMLLREWQDPVDPWKQLAFQMGVMLGITVSVAVCIAAQWFFLGIGLCLPDRKDQLLLDYHQRLYKADSSR